MNTTKEAVEPEIYDEVEEIKTSSTLTEQEAENLSDSSANDNGESGFPTPPTSEENIIDAEFSEDDIVNECNSLNSHVSIHSSREKPRSTDLATIPNDCHALIIPDDPMELQKFVSTGKIFIDAAQKLKNKKNITVEEYKALHNRAKEYGFIVLDAGLKLSLAIKNITTKGGYRSDLHPDEDFRSKEQIIFENFGLTDSQSRIFRKLTVTAVDKEKAYARNNDTIPTLSHAAKFADEEKEKISEAKTKSKVKENSSDEDTTEINDNIPEGLFDIIHADINALKNDFKASSITKDSVLLFIWADKNQMATAVDFIKSDGFEVVDSSVFITKKTKTGAYFKNNHRSILVGRKGGFKTPEFFKTGSVVYETEVGDGYAYYNSLITRMYPDAKILNLTPKTEETSVSSEEVSND